MASIVLIPNGAGDETAQDGIVGASEHWQGCVNVNDGVYTYEAGNNFQRDLFNLEEPILPDNPTITNVKVRAYVKGTASGTGVAETSIKTNGVVYDGNAENVTTSYALIETEYATNPQTGSAWTKAEIQALQAGSVLKRPGAQKQSHCGLVQVIVFFTIGTQTFYPITPTEIVPGDTGTWVTMDASALAPADATGVAVHVVNNNASDRQYGLRKPGSTDDRHNDIENVSHQWAMIGLDASRYFEAWVENTTDINIYVVAYTMAGVTFATNATEKVPGSYAEWVATDCSSEAPSAIGLIWEIVGYLGDPVGVRHNDSTDDRSAYALDHIFAIIGCDSSQICDVFLQDNVCHIYLVGYVTDGATFNTNATDVSLAGNSAYIDLAALPDVSPAPNMGFIEVFAASDPRYYGLRKNGESGGYYDIYLDGKHHPWAIVECDANRVIEGKIEGDILDFFVVGYSTAVVSVDYPISTSCNLSLTATVDRDVTWDRAISGANLSLATTIIKSWGRTKAISTALSLAASVSRVLAYARASSSNLALSTSASRVVAYVRATSSNLSLATSVNRVLAFGRAISSGLTLATTVVKSWGRTITSSASLSLSTTISKTVAYSRATSSNLSLAVTVVRTQTFNRAISVALSLSTAISRTVAYIRATSSNLSLTASVNRVMAYVRATSSSLSLTANVVRTRAFNKIISVAISLTTTIGRAVAYTRATSTSLTLATSVARSRGRTIVTSSALSLSVAISVFIRKLRSITSFTNLRNIVSATKRTISSFTNLRRIK